MKRINACLSAYVAAWWMKAIAILLVVVTCILFFVARPSSSVVPAWPTPTLVESNRIPEVMRGANNSLEDSELPDPVNLEDVVGLDLDAVTVTKFDPDIARQLSHVRIEFAPIAYNTIEKDAVSQRVEKQLTFLLSIPSVQAIELAGFVPIEALEVLHSNDQIRSLLTGELLIDGGKPVAGQQADVLVDIVASMPNVELWAVPRHSWYLFQRDRVATLSQHPSLETILSNPASAKMMEAITSAFPSQSVEAGYILPDRVMATWIGWALTVLIANLVVLQLADQLLVSSAPLIPRYYSTHRTTTAICLFVIAVVCAGGLIKSSVAVGPACLISLIAVLIPAVMLEYDRRRPVAGTLQLPACFAPAIAMLMPQFIRHVGHRWLWFDRFLAGEFPIVVGIILAATVGLMIVVFWRSVEIYGSSLAAHGRYSVLANSQAEMGKIWGKLGQSGRGEKGLKTRGVIASRALQDGTLSSPATAKGRRELIREGLICVPLRQLIIGFVVFAILFPIFSGASSEFRRDPLAYLKIFAAMAIMVLWFRPVIYWNERVRRLPNEMATLLPRKQYLHAVRSLLTSHLILPAILTGIAGSTVIVMKTGQWLFIPIALTIPVAILLTIISMIELSFTFQSLLAKSFICFGIGYAILLTIISVFATILHDQGIWVVIAVSVAATATAAVRWWALSRIRNFEFGRLA